MILVRSSFKWLCVGLLVCCVLLYFLLDYNLEGTMMQLRNRFAGARRDFKHLHTTDAYFIDSLGCRIPYFPVADENIIGFMSMAANYICHRKALLTSAFIDKSLLLNMNKTELWSYYKVANIEDIHCWYVEFKHNTDQKVKFMQNKRFTIRYNKSIPIEPEVEFIRVDCYQNNVNIYKDFFFFTTENGGGKANGTIASMDRDNNDITQKRDHVSVMIFGIDSISHLNFRRQMPQVVNYIKRNLPHVEFWGHTKVADNTYPNVVPILTGSNAAELNASCVARFNDNNSSYHDNCDLIWKRYKNAGFQTVYAEDVAGNSIFNLIYQGFREQPTDYYLYPLVREMERYIAYNKLDFVELCLGGRRSIEVLLEYIRKLIPLLQKRNFFSFFWSITLSHNFLNFPQLLDYPLMMLLQTLEQTAIINKTIIFLLSDHGLRAGKFRETYQGMVEERLPLLIALYPRWFSVQYPQAIKNLEQNARRLTSHFDIYETLVDLLDLDNLRNETLAKRTAKLTELSTLPRGISLFLPIPEMRTCEDAEIASHWCTCLERQQLNVNDSRVRRAAHFLVNYMNARLHKYWQCHHLYLDSILMAALNKPNVELVKNQIKTDTVDMLVRLQTTPGLGKFESTVRFMFEAPMLVGTISRINLYANQSWCVNNHDIEMFCYCII